jgi:peptide/nickel transport system permease protein
MAVAVKTLAPETQSAKKKAWFIFFRRLFGEKPLGAFGLVIVVLFFFIGIFADFLTPHDYLQHKLPKRLKGPSAAYLLGNDHFGRDVLSRLIVGARISMVVGVGASFLTVLVATVFGLISGYWGGKFDLILQRFVDAVMCFPWLFIVLTVMGIVGPGIAQVTIVLGVPWGINNIRTIRSVVLSVKQNAYVEAAIATGCSTPRILIQHILPQIVAPVIILFTITMGGAILGEGVVSFLGFGIPPPEPSWGGMLSLEGQKYLERAPLLALWPGLCLAIVVFGINMFGDAMRDLLDPKLKLGMGRFHSIKKKNPDSSIRGPRPRR